MPTPSFVPGDPCWADLMTDDVEGAKKFYGELLGWTFEGSDEELYGGYVTASKDGKQVAGIMAKMPDQAEMPNTWSIYLRSTDAEATAAAVADAGGQVFVPPMTVPEMGVMAMASDPSGAVVGIWEPLGHAGYQLVNETGSVGWHELNSRGYEAAVEFYRKAFGWETSTMADTPEFRYTTLGEGEAARAGIFDANTFLPEGVPSHWQIFLVVDNADEAVKKIAELGGQVIAEPWDDPHGRHARVTDAQGAPFMLHQSLR
ncbi:VOC family protein [Arthrobacter sp. YJM1]|uniref:VOC family protein n=2 Tax=Arthrobacter TaxID=1663 RepID=A0ABT9IN12_9MICC|nr:VOC family protein [Arthrobacter sp. YJM1]MDP5226672.1 VOC family protein [Arthrobacter sp. YJM1]